MGGQQIQKNRTKKKQSAGPQDKLSSEYCMSEDSKTDQSNIAYLALWVRMWTYLSTELVGLRLNRFQIDQRIQRKGKSHSTFSSELLAELSAAKEGTI